MLVQQFLLRHLDIFYFFSASDIIQSHLLTNKMLSMFVQCDIIPWIIDYLTFHLQFNGFQSLKPDTVYSNVEVAQGTVLAPFYVVCTHPIVIYPTNNVLLLNLPMTQC